MNKNSGSLKTEEADQSIALLEKVLEGTDKRNNLSELCALARRKQNAMAVNLHPKRARLALLLQDGDAKVRKNCARLFGLLGLVIDIPHLRSALEAETTMFVVPSILLALGALGDKQTVESYAKKLPEIEGIDPKQLEEIHQAINTILQVSGHADFQGLSAPLKVELTAPSFSNILADEARMRGIEGKLMSDCYQTTTQDYEALFRLRCFEEALIPLGSLVSLPLSPTKTMLVTWASKASQVAARFATLIEETLGKGVAFRIELRGVPHNNRAFLTHEIAKKLCSNSYLVNSVSDYSAELRITVLQAVSLVHAKLYVPSDERFAYRLGSIPASIAPNIAAAIMQFARPHLKPNANVLDPCCGSGTLLIERAKCSVSSSELVGVDISTEALSIARKNASAAGESISFIGGDMLKFSPKKRFDEVIANLPFGNRVGTGSSATNLYADFFSRLDDLMSADGTAIFFTTQYMPLLRIAQANGYRGVAQHRFDAGGLLPYAVIFKKG